MTSRGNEVKQSMDTVVSESWITLDPGFFGENIIVLTLQVPHNLRKASQLSHLIASQPNLVTEGDIPCFVVDLVTKARSVHDSE